ncbi:MAG: uracil-DNA glycosylase family protein [Chitinophagales bacterium]|nr:uracil-DNA glycosylase family protein [Chitinophagales bacterium]
MRLLLEQIRKCDICKEYLPSNPNPVLQASGTSRLLIVGQAPGSKVDKSGIPWDDASGTQLRRWLGIDPDIFYNPEIVALVPMGFCYPGKGASGDLPPRPECAPQWHRSLMANMNKVHLTLLIGQYAQAYYLGNAVKNNLTETVRAHREYLPTYLPLPHPSPRNRLWLSKNKWFEQDVLPLLQKIVSECLLK